MIHVLLAAYNEEAALGDVLNGLARALADGGYKVWVVDDGSRDGTARVAEEWKRQIPLVLIRHPVNQGLGAALQTGLAALLPVLAADDVLVTLDADNTHPPTLLPHLVAPLEEGRADLTIASRFQRGAQVVGVPFYRQLTGRGVSWIFRWFLPVPGVKDFTCGYRGYRGRLLKEGAQRWGRLVTENGFACQAEWLLKLSVLSPRVEEIPLVLRYDRKPTESKMPILKTIVDTLALLRRLRKIRAA